MVAHPAGKDEPERGDDARFRSVFGRDPLADDLAVLAATREALLLRLPARARRRCARVIARV